MPAPFHDDTADQQQARKGNSSKVKALLAMIVIVQHEKAQGIWQRFVQEPANFLEPLLFKRDASRFDEDTDRIQRAHQGIGAPEGRSDEREVYSRPAQRLDRTALRSEEHTSELQS